VSADGGDGKSWTVDLAEAARYLGYKEAPDAVMAERLRAAARSVTQAARPRYIYACWPLLVTEGGCELEGALFLPGASIVRHLSGCGEAFLLAATLGADVDALLRRTALTDILAGVFMDACATALVEQVMDGAEAEIQRNRAGEGKEKIYFTSRFSPGYGDLPLAAQPVVVRLLDAPRRIGLSVTATNILVPRKSVTAVFGAGTKPRPVCRGAGAASRCLVCPMREECPYKG
jgi:hypothetical protein